MEEIEVTPEYLKAFNDGYLIAKHMPELSEKLAQIKGQTPQLTGMKDGRDQYVREFKKERYPSWLRSDRFKSKDDAPDKQKDKERDGPDLTK
jgi:hypothetical protein